MGRILLIAPADEDLGRGCRMDDPLAGLPCSCCFIRRPETTLSTVSSALTTYPEPLTSASEPPTLEMLSEVFGAGLAGSHAPSYSDRGRCRPSTLNPQGSGRPGDAEYFPGKDQTPLATAKFWPFTPNPMAGKS
jgi:hypothetical protein